MPSKITIDDSLIAKAMKNGKHRTKKALVNEALKEYIQRQKQIQIINHKFVEQKNKKSKRSEN